MVIGFIAAYFVGVYTGLMYPVNFYTIQSGSMGEAIPTGSVVAVQARPFFYQPAEVITFKRGEQVVTHRVSEVVSEDGDIAYKTKGDANKEADLDKVEGSRVVGRVVGQIPHLGLWIDRIKTPYGLILLVIVPATILIYEEARKLKTEVVKSGRSMGKRRQPLELLVIPAAAMIFSGEGMSASYLSDMETSMDNGMAAATPQTQVMRLVINEFVADEPTGANEWVEIYNAGNVTVNLDGWYLRDSRDNAGGTKELPAVSIGPGGFYVYEDNNWLNNDTADQIRLFTSENVLIDSYDFNRPGDNKSIGREIDGGDVKKNCVTPTKGSSNNGSC